MYSPAMRALTALAGIVALVLVALAIHPITPLASAAAPPDHPERVTTELRRGWNLIGWLGPPTTARYMLRTIPNANRVCTLSSDGSDESVVACVATDGAQHDDVRIQSGAGIWIHMPRGAPAITSYSHVAAFRRPDVRLSEGINLTVWAGPDSIPLLEAVHAIDGLSAIYRWNAAEQRWSGTLIGADERPTLGAQSSHVDRGDALVLVMQSDSRWAQPIQSGTEVVFAGNVPPEYRDAATRIVAELDVLVNREFGLPALPFRFFIAGDWTSLLTILPNDVAKAHRQPVAASGGYPSLISLRVLPDEPALALSRFEHLVARYWVPGYLGALTTGRRPAPHWLHRGIEDYVYTYITDMRDGSTRQTIKLTDSITNVQTIDSTLATISGPIHDRPDRTPRNEIDLGYLAVTYLADRTRPASLLNYLALLGMSTGLDDWHDPFYQSFGVTVDRFFDDFASYRARVAPPARLAGSDGGPIIVIASTDPPVDLDDVADIIESVEGYFHRAYGFEKRQARWIINSPNLRCAYASKDRIVIGPGCIDASFVYAHEYFHILQVTLLGSVGLSIIPSADLFREVGGGTPGAQPPAHVTPGMSVGDAPAWLIEGSAEFAAALFASSRYEEARYEEERARWISVATDYFAQSDGRDALINNYIHYAVGALASEWLAAHAGEQSLVDFWRTRARHDSFRPAFSATFGLSTDEFYDEFGAWMRASFPRLDQ